MARLNELELSMRSAFAAARRLVEERVKALAVLTVLLVTAISRRNYVSARHHAVV